MAKVATCYELREIWGFGCPDPNCKWAKVSALPEPCHQRAGTILFYHGKPLPDDSVPVISPAGWDEKDTRRKSLNG